VAGQCLSVGSNTPGSRVDGELRFPVDGVDHLAPGKCASIARTHRS
jgi:hypothetical protein